MTTVNLIINKQFADEILSGQKKVEFRGFSDFYFDKFIEKTTDGQGIEFKGEFYYFIPYTHVRFQVGYTKKYFIVELLDICFLSKGNLPEQGEEMNQAFRFDNSISFENNIKANFDIENLPDDYMFFLLSLGKIVEKNV